MGSGWSRWRGNLSEVRTLVEIARLDFCEIREAEREMRESS